MLVAAREEGVRIARYQLYAGIGDIGMNVVISVRQIYGDVVGQTGCRIVWRTCSPLNGDAARYDALVRKQNLKFCRGSCPDGNRGGSSRRQSGDRCGGRGGGDG